MSAARPLIPEDTQARQARAADPEASAFVGANAGSGKTFVLTRRVVRLLLAGTDPSRILCLTFTEAAAAEMASRVFDTLATWTRFDDEKLGAELAEIEGRRVGRAELAMARRLFARALETPGGLKIQTIHGFCTALLHQFPLEANVAGHFDVLDERGQAEMLAAARAAVLHRAASRPNSELGEALLAVSAAASDQSFLAAIDALVGKRDGLLRWIRDNGDLDGALAALATSFGLDGSETAEGLAAGVGASKAFNADYLAALLPEMERGKPTDIGRAEAFRAALAMPAGEARAEAWLAIFFTDANKVKGAGTPRSSARWATKAVKDSFPDLVDRFDLEVARLEEARERMRAFRTVAATTALVRLADAVIGVYERAKAQEGLLDYDDLVVKTADLLTQADAGPWVQYKLDLGLDHVLVDEAQDTNPRQWQVIRTLVEEFFAGEGARPATRTFFAVGDEKQSIYSFQGAAPHLFGNMKRHFARYVRDAGLTFHDERLILSFRSTPDVLKAVDTVFEPAAAHDGLAQQAEAPVHEALRQNDPGYVEIWPLVTEAQEAEPTDWREPLDHEGPNAPARRLADRIAETIADWVAAGERLEGTGEPVRAEDVLVLVRKRGPFVQALDRALKARGLPTAGSDRVVLTDHIAVMDLMALARVALLPQDDLSLAAVLKSPLVGLDEDALFDLAYDRSGTLFEALSARRDAPAFSAAHAFIAEAMARADFLRPYEFFALLLGPEGGRARFRRRLGAEVDEVLDEFLGLALNYEQTAIVSLEGFLAWLSAVPTEIKRALDTEVRGVRTMTVHGAKGLEAPVVFLVDNCAQPTSHNHDPLILEKAVSEIPGAASALVWKQGKKTATDWQQTAIDETRRLAAEEYRRLLYVALTRARDRLVVCAFKNPYKLDDNGKAKGNADRPPEGCWYDLVSRALTPDAAPIGGTPDAPDKWRWQVSPGPAHAPNDVSEKVEETVAIPAWLTLPVAPLPTRRVVTPSTALEGEGEMTGEAEEAERFPPADALAAALRGPDAPALERGRVAHRLLELLPGLEESRQQAAGRRFLAHARSSLDEGARAALLDELLGVLRHPEFAPVFSAEGRAEVSIAGTLPGPDGTPVALSGQIDRLIVTDDAVLIVDYKTNRPVPESLDEVPAAYVTQLALYRAVLAGLYPGRDIRAALLWTAGPRLTEIPADALDRAAPIPGR
ncbi:MAG: double-strand break repair helicase AddA [Hyphomicrobiales bacterium]|nr:MAG: double-strand break repair helicase AddA [Hyphomicrobiales bacterium]